MMRAGGFTPRDQCCGCRRIPGVVVSGSVRDVNLGKDVRFGNDASFAGLMQHGGLGGGGHVVCEVGGKFGAWKGVEKGNQGGRLLGAALGHGEKLGGAVVRSVEALSFWLGGGRSGGGDGGSGGGGGGWGDGDVSPDADSGVEIFRHGEEEDGEVEEGHTLRESDERSSSLGSLDGERNFFVSGLEVINVEGMKLDEDFAPYEVLGFDVGTRYSKSDIMKARSRLLDTGWYKSVTIRWVADSEDAIKLVVLTEDAVYSEVSSFQCVNVSSRSIQAVHPPCLLPKSIQGDITTMLQAKERPTKQTLSDVQEKIEQWYHDQGYVCAKVKGFRSSEAGVLECHVDEGIITNISVSCEDETGHPIACHTNNDIILESLPKAVREGMQFNADAGKAAVRRVEQLGLFDKVNVLAASDSDCGDREGIALHIVVKESPCQSADVNTEWSFLCNDAGRPNLSTLQPGASLCVQHRNINGLNRTVSGSVSTSNLLRPEDDLRFKLEYVHPLVKGLQIVHPRLEGLRKLQNLTLRLLAFNKRKLSATYYDVDFHKEVPAVWIDRAGLKASIVEKLSNQSKLAYGVVLEEVATRDDIGTICKQRGIDVSTSGSKFSGIEHIAFLQMKITRSNLKSGETGLIGARDIFQVDQGVGLGTRAPMFNRHLLAMTRYMPLRKEAPKDQLPSVIVLHTRYGGCLGDVINYRSFSNGGPYSLRGNNIGELASFSRFIEVAGEVRIPVPQQMEAYGFVDSLTSLHNFGALCNDPGRLAERVGRGLMYGAGIKMGTLRIEYVIEGSDQTGSLKVYTGERY
ncbi:hypothetical protein M758_12G157500 [Ceratodon purpureus]|nr:hypothetical protein M758_12G157500 [Ceratodon purpureus]